MIIPVVLSAGSMKIFNEKCKDCYGPGKAAAGVLPDEGSKKTRQSRALMEVRYFCCTVQQASKPSGAKSTLISIYRPLLVKT